MQAFGQRLFGTAQNIKHTPYALTHRLLVRMFVCYTRHAMNERAPLPASVTQPLSGEALPAATSHEAPKSIGSTAMYKCYNQSEKGKARSERYRKSEKGKKATNKASKQWNDTHRATGV